MFLVLGKFNIGLALVVLLVVLLGLFNDRFALSPQLMFALLSLAFLSFGVEKIQNGMKKMGILYLFVFFVAFGAAVSSL